MDPDILWYRWRRAIGQINTWFFQKHIENITSVCIGREFTLINDQRTIPLYYVTDSKVFNLEHISFKGYFQPEQEIRVMVKQTDPVEQLSKKLSVKLEDHFKQVTSKVHKKCAVLKEWNMQNCSILLLLRDEIEGYKIKQNKIEESEVFAFENTEKTNPHAVDCFNNFIVTGGYDKYVRVHEFNGDYILAPIFESAEHSDVVNGVAILNEKFASVSRDGTMRIWDKRQSKSALVYDNLKSSPQACAFQPEFEHRIACAVGDQVLVFDTRKNKAKIPIQVLKGHTDQISKVVWDPRCDTPVSGGKDKTVRFWNWDGNGELDILINRHLGEITHLEIQKNFVLSADTTGCIQVFSPNPILFEKCALHEKEKKRFSQWEEMQNNAMKASEEEIEEGDKMENDDSIDLDDIF